jgi:superfamily II DNA or RNA helicase
MTHESEIPASLREMKARYRSGEDHLGSDFFAKVLEHATSYDRAAGYFSSGALNAWTGAVPGLAARNAKLRLLIAPELSPSDRTALQSAIDTSFEARECTEEELAHRLIDAATNASSPNPTDCERAELLAWLIASGMLELRFAWFQGSGGEELYHEKFGVVTLANGQRISFGGSANETYSGHAVNGERIDVFRSWMTGEDTRIQSHADDFAASWDGSSYIRVRELSEETLKMVRERAPQDRPTPPPKEQPAPDPATNKWRHQEEAVEAFLQARRGILEMATGTGKTRTAIKILTKLHEAGEVDSAIICTNGNDLLDQWHEEILDWCAQRGWSSMQYYGKHHDGSSFPMLCDKSALITSRRNLHGIVKRMALDQKQRTILIHDEVHGLGEPSSQEQLRGQHTPFAYTLGLSATPEREYDEASTSFIKNEVGDVIYQFGLKEAIERGILVEFDYHVIEFDLTEGDKSRIQGVYAKKAARARVGRPMSKEEVWIELARVYKTAEEKMPSLAAYLESNPASLDRCIIFTETKEHAEPLYEVLHGLRLTYSQYFDTDQSSVLDRFARGDLDCLVTCHKVSQGIDIRDLRTVILVSSSRALLETIQRLGRCLRTDPAHPNKRSLVVDFCRSDAGKADDDRPTADATRVAWLHELSTVKTKP